MSATRNSQDPISIRGAIALSAVALVFGLAAPVANASFGDIEIASRGADGALATTSRIATLDLRMAESSREASLSADGQRVAFTSTADNLSRDDNRRFADVFVRDIRSGAVQLVSRATGVAGAAAVGHSSLPSISPDGRYVTFRSQARNLGTSSKSSKSGVAAGNYVRDLVAGTTRLLEGSTGESPATISRSGMVAYRAEREIRVVDLREVGQKADHRLQLGGKDLYGVDPKISANGRFVAFAGSSRAQLKSESRARLQISRWDLENDTVEIVSRASGRLGALGDNGTSSQPSISGDGRFVAFTSISTNLDGGNPARLDVFVRDMNQAQTRLVSRGHSGLDPNGGEPGERHSSAPAISENGHFVAFESESNFGNENPRQRRQIFVRDLRNGALSLESRARGIDGEVGNAESSTPAISASGRYVVFSSSATQLVKRSGEGDWNQVYRRELDPDNSVDPGGTDSEGGGVAEGNLSQIACPRASCHPPLEVKPEPLEELGKPKSAAK